MGVGSGVEIVSPPLGPELSEPLETEPSWPSVVEVVSPPECSVSPVVPNESFLPVTECSFSDALSRFTVASSASCWIELCGSGLSKVIGLMVAGDVWDARSAQTAAGTARSAAANKAMTDRLSRRFEGISTGRIARA